MLNDILVLDQPDRWEDPRITELFVRAAIPDESLRRDILKTFETHHIQIKSIPELTNTLRAMLRDSLDWGSPALNANVLKAAQALVEYENSVRASWEALTPAGKPNPTAIFWPNKERDAAQDLYQTVPVIRNLGWINSKTPIGSAGSCFASEISFALQKRKFNYVLGEKALRPEDGVFTTDIEMETGLQGSSANWGILFNTPSFRQLAEVAFGERVLKPLIFRQVAEDGENVYRYPYRENIFFRSPEAFQKDHPQHLKAAREVFTKCEVFVITLGLNECWQFQDDGTFMSRNPRLHAFGGLVKHRILSVAENIENIQRFIDVIRAHNSKMKFVITLSPVPFIATARAKECHVVTANTHSKSVLRVAAEEICAKNRDCAYFPSYEVVTVCTRDPWKPDGRHVTREAVAKVMQAFDAMFVIP